MIDKKVCCVARRCVADAINRESGIDEAEKNLCLLYHTFLKSSKIARKRRFRALFRPPLIDRRSRYTEITCCLRRRRVWMIDSIKKHLVF